MIYIKFNKNYFDINLFIITNYSLKKFQMRNRKILSGIFRYY